MTLCSRFVLESYDVRLPYMVLVQEGTGTTIYGTRRYNISRGGVDIYITARTKLSIITSALVNSKQCQTNYKLPTAIISACLTSILSQYGAENRNFKLSRSLSPFYRLLIGTLVYTVFPTQFPKLHCMRECLYTK